MAKTTDVAESSQMILNKDDTSDAHAVTASGSPVSAMLPVDTNKKFDDIFDLLGAGPLEVLSAFNSTATSLVEDSWEKATSAIRGMIYSGDEADKGDPSDLPPPPKTDARGKGF